MIEVNDQLYGIVDDTIVSLSSIREFDPQKDWLAQQLGGDDSSRSQYSDQVFGELPKIKIARKNTLRDLTDFLDD